MSISNFQKILHNICTRHTSKGLKSIKCNVQLWETCYTYVMAPRNDKLSSHCKVRDSTQLSCNWFTKILKLSLLLKIRMSMFNRAYLQCVVQINSGLVFLLISWWLWLYYLKKWEKRHIHILLLNHIDMTQPNDWDKLLHLVESHSPFSKNPWWITSMICNFWRTLRYGIYF